MNQDIIDTLKYAKEFVGIYTKDDSGCIAHSAIGLFNHIGKLLNEISTTPSKEDSPIDSGEGVKEEKKYIAQSLHYEFGKWQLVIIHKTNSHCIYLDIDDDQAAILKKEGMKIFDLSDYGVKL